MNPVFKILLFIIGIYVVIGGAYVPQAQASITVSPTRIILEGRMRSAEVMLLNLSTTENTYRLGWIYNKMNENGGYDRVDETFTPDLDVAERVMFSPRQVIIPPGSRQKVRFSLRRPADLPDGEYRAHMVFQKLPDEDFAASIGEPETGARLAMNVILGFSIPVIVRQGEYDANATITNPRFVEPTGTPGFEQPGLEFDINRSGKHSLIGRVVATWDRSTRPDKIIGRLNNVVLFPEIDRRIVRINLRETQISGGNITIRYMGEGANRNVIYAQTTIPVGQ